MSPEAAQTLFAQALQWHQTGRLSEARAAYEQILAVHRNHHHALHLLGAIEASMGNPFLARRLMQSALRIAPDEPDVLANLAQVLFHLGEPSEAVPLCERALLIQAQNPRCHFTMGRSLAALLQHGAAVAHFDQSIAQEPDFAQAHAQRALSLHQMERMQEALAGYDRALALKPEQAEVLNHRGHAKFLHQQWDAARLDIERAIALKPQLADAHYHLGLVHQQTGQLALARACFEETLRLHPTHTQALVHLAYTLQSLLALPQACIALLDRALAVGPPKASILAARGGLLLRLRQTEEALQDYEQALALEPGNAKFHTDRGEALFLLERVTEARTAFHQAQKLGGDPVYLQYVLASLGEGEVPSAAPASYVTDLFDGYAKRFDAHLQSGLKYRSPALLTQRLFAYVDRPALNVLDLGCGTGLCGPLLRERTTRLVGVDLSPKMLSMAQTRGCYDELVCAELKTYLGSQHQPFDWIVAADVFVYLGDLRQVFENAERALRDAGLFAFTVERSPVADWLLMPSRRFAHSREYLTRLAPQTGFALLEILPSVIRQEGGLDLEGYLVVMRKAVSV